MKLKIPPVIQFLAAAFAIGLIDWQLPHLSFAFVGQRAVSGALFLLGLTIGVIAIVGFRQAETTVNPMDPSKANKLVSNGLYNITRNPMYLGLLIGLISLTVWFGNPLGLGALIFFIWFMTEFQIKPEEEVLREKFGADYEVYCKRVRRWI